MEIVTLGICIFFLLCCFQHKIIKYYICFRIFAVTCGGLNMLYCLQLLPSRKGVYFPTPCFWVGPCELSWLIEYYRTNVMWILKHRPYSPCSFCFFFFFWLCWVFVAAHELSLVAASGSYSLLQCAGFSLRWLLLLWSTGSRPAGFSSCGTQPQ